MQNRHLLWVEPLEERWLLNASSATSYPIAAFHRLEMLTNRPAANMNLRPVDVTQSTSRERSDLSLPFAAHHQMEIDRAASEIHFLEQAPASLHPLPEGVPSAEGPTFYGPHLANFRGFFVQHLADGVRAIDSMPPPYLQALPEAAKETIAAGPQEEVPLPLIHFARHGLPSALLTSLATNLIHHEVMPNVNRTSAEPGQGAANSLPEQAIYSPSVGTPTAALFASIRPARSGDMDITYLPPATAASENVVKFGVPEDASVLAPAQLEVTSAKEPVFAPHDVRLLASGVAVSIAGMRRAVQMLVEPILDAEGKPVDLLHIVGIGSWMLAAALTCEGIRRRLPNRANQRSKRSVGLPHLMPEGQP